MPADWGTIGTWVGLAASLAYNAFNHRQNKKNRRAARFDAAFGGDINRSVQFLREAMSTCEHAINTSIDMPQARTILAPFNDKFSNCQNILCHEVGRIKDSPICKQSSEWRALLRDELWDSAWNAHEKVAQAKSLADLTQAMHELRNICRDLQDKILSLRDQEI